MILFLLLCTIVVVATPLVPIEPRASCASGYHIVVARATLELPGEGSTGELANNISSRIPGSDSTGLSYPALPAPLYHFSEQAGVKQLRSDIEAYVKSCKAAKIVLLGYDQGAYVIGDVLGGSGVNATDFIKGEEAEAIKGIVLLGDASFVPGQPYDAGTSTHSGTYPRSAASLSNLRRFTGITKSYCDEGDTACASGNSPAVNRDYLTKYEAAATEFIVGLYK